MQKRNTQIVTSVVTLLGVMAGLFGIPIIEINEGQLLEVIDQIIRLAGLLTTIIAPVISWISEWKKGGLTVLGKMK